MHNEALIFIKPHAVTDTAIHFVENFLRDRGIELLENGILASNEIRERGIIDRHYFAIANAAVVCKPSQLELTEQAMANFKTAFDISWEEACQKDLLFNAIDLQQKLGGLSGIELNKILGTSKQVKMAPGLYAALIADKEIYGINGFYLALREVFTALKAQVIWYHARFNPQKVSWADFRQKIIGATDPSKAVNGSLRSEFFNRYQELGLAVQPSMSENGVHASAGPLEGLRERQVWLGTAVNDDPLAKELLQKGVQVEDLLENPVITLNDKHGPVFDLTEDIDADALLALF